MLSVLPMLQVQTARADWDRRPVGFGRVFSWLFFFFFCTCVRVHALALALASPLFSSSPFLLSFSSFFSFVVARVLVPLPLPLHDLLPLNLLARRSAGF